MNEAAGDQIYPEFSLPVTFRPEPRDPLGDPEDAMFTARERLKSDSESDGPGFQEPDGWFIEDAASRSGECSKTKTKIKLVETHIPDCIFIFRMPSSTTAKEEASFQERMKKANQAPLDYVKRRLGKAVFTELRPDQVIGLDEMHSCTLEGVRLSVIDMIRSYCCSLANTQTDLRDSRQCGMDSADMREKQQRYRKCRCDVITFKSVNRGALSSDREDRLIMCVRMNDNLAELLADMEDYPMQISEEALEILNIKLPKAESYIQTLKWYREYEQWWNQWHHSSFRSGRRKGCPQEDGWKQDRWSVPAYIGYDAQFRHLLKKYSTSSAIQGCTEYFSSAKEAKRPPPRSILRQVDRVRLLGTKLMKYLNLEEMIKQGFLSAALFPHDASALENLRRSWGSIRHIFSLMQPIDEIRDYFGEQIAFYFLFTMFLTHCFLVLLAVAFINEFLHHFGCFRDDVKKLVDALAVVVWCIFIRQLWDRAESYYCNRWGMDTQATLNAGKESRRRNPRCHAPKPVVSSLDNNVYELTANPRYLIVGRCASHCLTAVFLCFVTFCVGLGIWIRMRFHKFRLGVALAVTLQIKLLDFLWDIISKRLATYEQHLTLQAFAESISVKLFSMKCIYAFSSYFFIAYLQPVLFPKECAAIPGGCPGLLSQNLSFVFMIYIVFGIIGLPWSFFQSPEQVLIRVRAHKHGFTPSKMEREAAMPEYNDDELISDWLEILFPLALVAWFGMTRLVALTLLCLLSNMMQLRFDAMKLTSTFRRPFPRWQMGLGMWSRFFTGICFLAILFNVSLVQTQLKDTLIPMKMVCPEVVRKLETVDLLWVAQTLQWAVQLISCLLADRLIRVSFKNVSDWTDLQRKRQTYQRKRIVRTDIFDYQEKIEIQASESESRAMIQRADEHISIQRMDTSFGLQVAKDPSESKLSLKLGQVSAYLNPFRNEKQRWTEQSSRERNGQSESARLAKVKLTDHTACRPLLANREEVGGETPDQVTLP